MYNLLVTSKAGVWDGPAPTYHFSGQRFLTHTPTHLRDRFIYLRPETIAELCSIPTLFAYESDLDRPAKFGRITNVAQSIDSVALTFRVDPTAPILSRDELLDRQIELGIADPYELRTTHWAIKDVDITGAAQPSSYLGTVQASAPMAPGNVRMKSMTNATRRRVFISYSHQDATWPKRLQVHLRPIVRDGLIELWDDSRILPGTEWRSALGDALLSADCAVFLISADFLASDFILNDELPPLLEKAATGGTQILSVIVGHCMYTRLEHLSRYQAVNPPTRPLTAMPGHEAEETLFRVAEAIASDSVGSVERARGSHGSAEAPQDSRRSKPDHSTESPADHTHVFDENDQCSLLETWLRSRTREQNIQAIVFLEVDKALNLPPGTATLHIEAAGIRLGYEVLRRGATTILFRVRPLPPRNPPPNRGWSPSRDGFGGF